MTRNEVNVAVLFALFCVSAVFCAPPAKAVGCKPLYGVIYDPFALSTKDICLSKEQVKIDVQIMATLSKSIRIYNLAVCPEATTALLEEAAQHDMTVLLGLLVGGSASDNDKEVKALEKVMKEHSGVVQAVVVGTDAIVSGKIGSSSRYSKILSNVELLVEYIERVKKIMRKNGWKHPVTTAEGWGVWESEHGAALAEAVDFICLKITPHTEGRPAECPSRAKSNCIDAAVYANARATGLSKFYSKDVWVCETSWPTEGKRCCYAIPEKKNGFQAISSASAATHYLNQFVKGAGDRPYYISSAFDRDWRRVWSPCANCAEKNLALSSFENGVCDLCEQEYQLGFFDQHRERKTSFKIPTVKCTLPALPTIRVAESKVKATTKVTKAPAKTSKETPKKVAKTPKEAPKVTKASAKTSKETPKKVAKTPKEAPKVTKPPTKVTKTVKPSVEKKDTKAVAKSSASASAKKSKTKT